MTVAPAVEAATPIGARGFGQQRPARVLIVDDERQNRELLEVMLTPEGFEFQSASSGEHGLRLVAEHQPDLILVDAMMPGMDGFEFAAAIKAGTFTRNIPIIMVTALDGRESRLAGLSAGAEDFLSKPVDCAELCARVRNLLRLKAYGEHYGKYSEILEAEVTARTAELVERTQTLEQQTAALRRSEERTNYALGAALMGIWEVDLSNGHVTWSETMGPIFGLSADKLPATLDGAYALVHPDDRAAVEYAMSGRANASTGHEVEFRVPDAGGTRWVLSRAQIICDGDGQAVRLLGVATDIGARKSLEGQLRQAQKMDAIGQLAGGVAHDFNNILTAILGYSNFVIETFEPGDARCADMEQIVRAGERAATLTRQLLAFSRKQILQPIALDLNGLVLGIRPMLGRLIGEHIDLVPTLAPGLGLIRADSGQVEQVLMNLVVNARDAMPSGGRLSVETANVDLDQSFMEDVHIEPGPYVMLAVSDTGIGMAEDVKRRLFEPFFTTKEQGKGTGLGLAMVYGIVKQSGGYIWVYSEPGKGSAFKVYLPRVNAELARVSPSAAKTAPPLATEAVLIVEDDDAVRSLTRTMLERVGYRVFEASRPEEAEVLFAQHHAVIDLLITDVIMPGGSGPALHGRLTVRHPDLKVLFISGFTDDTVVHQGQLDPDIEFLQKPFTGTALYSRVRELLSR